MMRKTLSTRTALMVAGLLIMSVAQAQSMSAADVKAAKDRVGAEYKAARAICDSMAGNPKDICVAEVKGKEKVALAELQFARSGTAAAMQKVAIAKAEAGYDVAKERCDDLAGNAKDVCLKEAQAAEVRIKADAKVIKDGADSRKDAANDKRAADYKVAIEKCDALAGDAKSSCISTANVRFGKS